MILTYTPSDNYRFFNPYTLRTEYEHSTLSDQQRRAYQRVKTGINAALRAGEYLRFMTLTTADGVKKQLNKSFNHLKMRIERANRKRDGFTGFKFNKYFKIETYEGNGVLHIVYRGTRKHYIPQKWISDTWAEIHQKSEVVDIRVVKQSDRLAAYLTANYLMKNPIKRMSYGWAWLWLGFVKSWEHIKETYLNGWQRKTDGSIENSIKALSFATGIGRKTSRQRKLF